ncbi:helix-turn-helix transcriptional regulator [Tianweitania sp. BSSL-BM11]|uniref:Helix-turn-helix transcriptional regulator n=1 Tax=Tianweitania aestuarii TaxID=2814886 RepID=A0ABS5RX88_9HYPH|nr:helix-turn-helix transcriptional regulator [Tianweitania aestuarii]
MTPFGARLRQLRQARGVEQKEMAAALGVSASYLSALEHGRRGKPTWVMIQKIIGYFNVIWDEADDLQRLAEISDPRVVIDTTNLAPEATALANHLAAQIRTLSPERIAAMQTVLDKPAKATSK